MMQLRQHIAFKISIYVLVAALFLPTAAKFAHLFNHHKHEVCNGEPAAHLHTLDLECDFYKFKVHTPFTVPQLTYSFEVVEANHKIPLLHYTSLKDYKPLYISLRAPPHKGFLRVS